MDTALREVEEETGLERTELRVIPRFKTYVKFHFIHGQEKIYDTVILYLAQTQQAVVRIEPSEHSGFAWFLYPDALKTLGHYIGIKKALKQANDFLQKSAASSRSARPAPHHSSPSGQAPRSNPRPASPASGGFRRGPTNRPFRKYYSRPAGTVGRPAA